MIIIIINSDSISNYDKKTRKYKAFYALCSLCLFVQASIIRKISKSGKTRNLNARNITLETSFHIASKSHFSLTSSSLKVECNLKR